jgi:hypothetical protein
VRGFERVAFVRSNSDETTGQNVVLPLQTDIARAGQAIAVWVKWDTDGGSLDRVEYSTGGVGEFVRGTTQSGNVRLELQVIPVAKGEEDPAGDVEVDFSGSLSYWVAAHLYEFVDLSDMIIDHDGGDEPTMPCPPGGMGISGILVGSADVYDAAAGLTLRINDGSERTGDEASTNESDQGSLRFGWQHTGTSRETWVCSAILRPMRRFTPTHRAFDRRDRLMVGHKVGQRIAA